LLEALRFLEDRKIIHVSFSVECKTPRLAAYISDIRLGVSMLLSVPVDSVCITATSGEDLTAFGRGEGIMVTCAITVRKAQREI
jgi:2-C-methyl-D-erythritol 2,4-cyclodiphosphate synthase